MKRNIITIDEDKCTGCELCLPNCPEGAIQIIDEKARLISDLFCDGLGACLGHCPEGAITIEEREAEPYDERRVMENVVKQGECVIKAHLEHLKDHNQDDFLKTAVEYLEEKGLKNPLEEKGEIKMEKPGGFCGCPGSKTVDFSQDKPVAEGDETGRRPSHLSHWPIQMHLLSPMAPHYKGSDLVLAADCTAFTSGDFHKDYLKDKTLAIACPKLDSGREIYLDKLVALIDEARINTLSVLIMQVPCCRGLLELAQEAAAKAERKVPIKATVIGLRGEVLSEEWV